MPLITACQYWAVGTAEIACTVCSPEDATCGRKSGNRTEVLNSGMPMPLTIRFRSGCCFRTVQSPPASRRFNPLLSINKKLMEPAIRATGKGPDRLCAAQPAGRAERVRASQSDYPSLWEGSGLRLRKIENAANRGMPIPGRGCGRDSLHKVQPGGRYLRVQERQSNQDSHPLLSINQN